MESKSKVFTFFNSTFAGWAVILEAGREFTVGLHLPVGRGIEGSLDPYKIFIDPPALCVRGRTPKLFLPCPAQMVLK